MNSSSQNYISTANENEDISTEETPISQIYNSQYNQKTFIDTRFTLQIIHIKKLDKDKFPSFQNSEKYNNIFSLTLSDEDYHFNGFIVLLDKNQPLLELYDIIDVYNLVIIPNKNQQRFQKLILIKHFKVQKKLNYLLGNPRKINKKPEDQEQSEYYSNNQIHNGNNNINIIVSYIFN
jgi:hypothetical protein